MNIVFKEVTKENYDDVCLLDVKESQQDFIAYNALSLVETFYNEGYVSKAIYQGELLIGFMMLVYPSAQKVEIWRFMIDKKYQNRGLGRKAFNLLLTLLKQDNNITVIEISYDPANEVAKNLYLSCGFVEVGMDDENEEMVAVLL